MQWMWPLHSGHVLGAGGWLLVCLSGLVSAGLFITGFIRWRQKRRITKFHNQRVIQLGQLSS
ncbi:MAG: hypothetical protein HOP18_22635 [Deltaproteobacteria bacterium]|nr:hypothetical protein [Deltaproteobacteria bacterium]